MSFTDEQKGRIVSRMLATFHKIGVRNQPFDTDELGAIVDAIKAVFEGSPYRNAMSNAIDGARPGATPAQKKVLHQVAIEAIIKEGLF